MYRLFAVTAPGLDVFTRKELANLGFASSTATGLSLAGEGAEEAGGVEFETDLSGLYRANLHLRTANRILVRFGEFNAAAFSELHKKASRLPWEQYLHPGQPVALRVTCHKSRLYHSDGVAERLARAISDRLGRESAQVPFDEGQAAGVQLVVARLVHDTCTVSIDTSGAPLHRRGYRLETAKAPLRETLAAGLLMAAGWTGSAPLIDPFCGSGTIAIEAALMAGRIAPGKNRRFAFMDWPGFEASLWQGHLQAAAAEEIQILPPIHASDRDTGAVRIAAANAGRAGVEHHLQLDCRAFSAITPPSGRGWVVTNPPYGVRVSPHNDLRNLYSQLGNVLCQACPGWQVGILCSQQYLAGHTRIKFDQALPLINGGLPVKLFLGKVR